MGFEPMIFSVKGKRLKPLVQRAMLSSYLLLYNKNFLLCFQPIGKLLLRLIRDSNP